MGSNRRRLLSAIAVLVGVFVLAATAFAGHQLENFPTDKADSPDLPEAAQNHPGPDDGGGGDGGGPTEDNHGQCVAIAAQDETEGLDQWHKGLFVSSVAQSDLTGDDCDEDSEYTSLRDEAIEADSPGGSEAEVGAGATTSEQAKEDGKGFGQQKKDEHAPGS